MSLSAFTSRRNWQDLLELFLLPGIAAFLPWAIAFRILRWVAFHCNFPYRSTVDQAWQQAMRRGHAQSTQEHVWKSERRLVTLVDHADMYLSLTRGTKFGRRHLHITGQWPDPGNAGVLVTFHWGAGMFGLYNARCHGLQVVALIESLKPQHFSGRPVLYRYAKARVAQVHKALQQPTADISATLRPVLQALRDKKQVLTVADVPADRASTHLDVYFAKANAKVPKALLKAVVAQQVPITFYITGIDLLNGNRFLRIRQLGVFNDVQNLADTLFRELDGLIAEKNVAWHFWDQAPRFFDAA